MNTNFPLTLFLVAAVSLPGATTHGGIYSWVDEKGKTHYGDRIPEKDRSQAAEVKLGEVNGMQAVSPRPSRQPEPTLVLRRSDKQTGQQPGTNNPRATDMSCEEKKQAYRESERCFAGCSINIPRGGVNVSGCGHCVNVAKPNC